MRVPLRWLEEYIDLPTDDVSELKYALDMLGHTVEGIEVLDVGWSDVYVGRVLEIAPHPEADKVRICQVDSGTGPTQIICGAWNFEEGATVAVARPGAVLPGDFDIAVRTIRGVESHGMICSERELGLGDNHEGIMVLRGDEELGTAFADHVELPDVVFDLDVTPNRPDALSMVGVARDLAAWFDVQYRNPSTDVTTREGATPVSVEIADPSGCRRFTAREVTGVSVGQSPLKLRHRLHKAGIRSISNVVDVTNYVMLELGHPLHAFDADSIVGDLLVVKRAEPGETLTTLDNVERELDPEDLIIYDGRGATSMSGTMGGARSEVSSETSRVLMEAASWDPPTIMRMWRRHDLRSEAATRFERGVDPNLADMANRRASAMVAELTAGEVLEGAVDVVAVETDPVTITLAATETGRLLGPGFEAQYVTEILTRLGMTVEGSDPMKVTVPTFRPDVTRPADLIEEVARIHGFDKFDATLPTGPAGGLTSQQRRLRRLVGALTGLGLDQAINLPFVSDEDVSALESSETSPALLTVKNPLREEESKLRPSLLPGLLSDLRYNQSHGNESVALFEIGTVFEPTPDTRDPRLPAEASRLAWAITGQFGMSTVDDPSVSADADVSLAIWDRLAAALGLSAAAEQDERTGFHPGRTAKIMLDGVPVGYIGELAPAVMRHFEIEGRVAVAELDLDPLLTGTKIVDFQIPSPYPHVDFDLSFLVPSSVPAGTLIAATSAAAGDLLESARIFDEFRSENMAVGERALAITYRIRAADRTLDAAAISDVRSEMISSAESLGASLRGA